MPPIALSHQLPHYSAMPPRADSWAKPSARATLTLLVPRFSFSLLCSFAVIIRLFVPSPLKVVATTLRADQRGTWVVVEGYVAAVHAPVLKARHYDLPVIFLPPPQ